MNIKWLKLKGSVKGIFSPDIPYVPVLENGDSSPYFGTYEGQKYGRFETSCCWDFSGAEIAETRFEMLWKMDKIPQESKDWLKSNGYIDDAGDFYFSRRWIAILSGVRDSGNDPKNFWDLAGQAGLIPNKMLPYDTVEASKWITQNQFNNDYFNPQVITKEMETLGKEFARRFKIQAEDLSGGYLKDVFVDVETYLKEGSLQIGHPVPQNGTWNTTFVNYPVGRTIADHATELYKFDASSAYPYFIYDSYEPHLKQLSKDYFIPILTRVSIQPLSPVPALVPVSDWQKFWDNVFAWLANKPLPYPTVQIGKV